MYNLVTTTHTVSNQFFRGTQAEIVEIGQEGQSTLFNASPDSCDVAEYMPRIGGYAAIGPRPSSARRNFLSEYLWESASYKCTVCGLPTKMDVPDYAPDKAVLMHIVPSGANRMGWTPGNIMSGCRACNKADDGRDLTQFIQLFAGWYAIPTLWPSGEIYNKSENKGKTDTEARASARHALGLPY